MIRHLRDIRRSTDGPMDGPTDGQTDRKTDGTTERTTERTTDRPMEGPMDGRTDAQCTITDKKSIVIFSCSMTLLDYWRSFF